jgi:hypothetical protein
MLARTMQHAQIQATSSRLKGSLIPPTYNSSTHSSKTTPEPWEMHLILQGIFLEQFIDSLEVSYTSEFQDQLQGFHLYLV